MKFTAPLPLRRRGLGRSALLALGVLTLGACTGPGSALNPGILHPIDVKPTDQMLGLSVDEALEGSAAQRIAVFGRNYLVGGNGPLTIAYPDTLEPAEGKAAARGVAVLLARAGVPAERMLSGAYDAEKEERDDIVVSFRAATAHSAGCPDAWGDPTRDPSNKTPLRFGCSVQQNFAAMIDRPGDLVEPRPVTPADAGRRQDVIEKYRRGEATGAEPERQQTETDE